MVALELQGTGHDELLIAAASAGRAVDRDSDLAYRDQAEPWVVGAQLIEALRRQDPSLEFFGVGGEKMRAAGCDIVVAQVEENAVTDMAKVQSFTPDFKIGNINLTGSMITSRLTKIKEFVDKLGWEFYQDIDGSIVVKPQLFNLDVTNTITVGATSAPVA